MAKKKLLEVIIVFPRDHPRFGVDYKLYEETVKVDNEAVTVYTIEKYVVGLMRMRKILEVTTYSLYEAKLKLEQMISFDIRFMPMLRNATVTIVSLSPVVSDTVMVIRGIIEYRLLSSILPDRTLIRIIEMY